eukprot:1014456-Prorocentrum_minimum.AAC.1
MLQPRQVRVGGQVGAQEEDRVGAQEGDQVGAQEGEQVVGGPPPAPGGWLMGDMGISEGRLGDGNQLPTPR